MGQPESALTQFQRSIDLAQQQGDFHSQAIALDNLGVILQALGREAEAITAHTQTLNIYTDLGDRHSASATLNHLGIVHRKLGHYALAEGYFGRSIALKRELNDQHGLANVLVNLAILQVNEARWVEALQQADEARRQAEAAQADEALATSHVLLGVIKGEQGDLTGAANHYAQAIIIAWNYHDSLGQRINRSIGRHLQQLRDNDQTDKLGVLCRSILSIIQMPLSSEHPDALQLFNEYLPMNSRR